MDALPDVSVITPTKNRRALLLEAINGVRAQTLLNWELLVVDDGSDDGTSDEVMRLSETDSRIRFLRRPGDKSGANACRNHGISQSRSDLVVLLDSDDMIRPACLLTRMEKMRGNADLDFAVFRAGVFEKAPGDLTRLFHPQSHGDDLLRFLSLECPWQTTGPIWRKSFLEKIGGFDESLLSMQDVEMHVRAICAAGKYVCFPEVDHDIRWQWDQAKISVRHFREPAYIEGTGHVREKLVATVENSGLMTWSRQRAILGLNFGASQSWAQIGRLGKAAQTWIRGCREYKGGYSLLVTGLLILCVLRPGGKENGWKARLVNKWKGWVRFRQEPAIPDQIAVPAGRDPR